MQRGISQKAAVKLCNHTNWVCRLFQTMGRHCVTATSVLLLSWLMVSSCAASDEATMTSENVRSAIELLANHAIDQQMFNMERIRSDGNSGIKQVHHSPFIR